MIRRHAEGGGEGDGCSATGAGGAAGSGAAVGRSGDGGGAAGGDDGGGEITNLDQLLDYLGNGRWTLLYFSAVAIFFSCISFPSVGAAFIAPLMNFTCRHPPVTTFTNHTSYYTYNTTTPPDATTIITTAIDECVYWVNSSDGSGWQELCTEWDFDHSTFGNTLTSEMSLVCDRSFLVPLYQSLYMLGNCVGALVGGCLSDRFGRRPVFVWSAGLMVVALISSTFLSNFQLILGSRFVMGMFHMLAIPAGFTLVMETTRQSMRPMLGILLPLGWALGEMVYGGLGYIIRQHQHLQLATSLPFIAIFPILWLMRESPRWLLVRGEVQAAQQEVNRAARWHGIQPPPPHTLININKTSQQQVNDAKNPDGKTYSTYNWLCDQVLGFLVIFRTKTLCLYTVVMALNFFTVSLVYFGLSLSAVNLSADPYIYMSLNGLAEIPSYTLSGPLLARAGRKTSVIGGFLITGVSVAALSFIPSEAEWAVMFVAMVGKMSITMVFAVLYVYDNELFPTAVRVQALGIGIMVSRIGSVVSPIVNDILVPVYSWMTSVVFGGLSVIAGLITFLLPETMNTTLPDIDADMEHSLQVLEPDGRLQHKTSRFERDVDAVSSRIYCTDYV